MIMQMVRDVMTDCVVVVSPNCGYRHLVDVLADLSIGAVPVVDDDDHVLGVVSEADVLQAKLWRGVSGETAATLMRSPAITIPANATIAEAARTMEARHVKRLPVLDDDGTLIGIVSRRDLLRRAMRSDAAIERDILDEILRRTSWLDPALIRVRVADGAVTLSGTADRRSVVQLAARLARGVDGVVNVVNELTWEQDDTVDGRRYFFNREQL